MHLCIFKLYTNTEDKNFDVMDPKHSKNGDQCQTSVVNSEGLNTFMA